MRYAAVLGLVLLTAFAPLQSTSTQDETRLALTRALVSDGTTRIDRWHRTEDRARYGGHYYTDKAPGMSVAAIPAYGLERAVGGEPSPWQGRWSRWLMRLLVNGPFLVLCGVLVAREARSFGRGGPLLAVAVTLGTILGALSSIMFSHVAAAAIGFSAFVAYRARPWLAGALASTALLFEYQSGIVLVVLGFLVAYGGARRAASYAFGALPPLLALAVYDWVSFGSPFRLSYRYVDNVFAAKQRSGFFGIGVPSAETIRAVLVGGTGASVGTGILVTAPVLLGSIVGAVLLIRRRRVAEIGAIAVICAAYVIYDAGYFAPYGGTSPGPRFLAPALPFALLPLAATYARWPRATISLVAVSVAVSTDVLLAWFWNNGAGLHVLPPTIWSVAGLPEGIGVALVFGTAALAVLTAVLPVRRVQ